MSKHLKIPCNRGNQSLIVGGGNLSVPILICTGLELASALYVGDTSYIKKVPKYDATTNVEQFINEFFTGRARQMPLLIWDGVRNGIDHLFFPKPLQYSNSYCLLSIEEENHK